MKKKELQLITSQRKQHHVGMPHLGLHEITDCFSAATESTATVCILC